MANTNKYPFRRNLYIILTLTGLVCLFIALNYLVIIPQQQDWFNKKAFRILQDQTNDFTEMVGGYATYYKNYADTPTKKLEWNEGFNNPVAFMQSLKSSFDGYNVNRKDMAKLKVLFVPDSVEFINSKIPGEPFYKNLADFIQPIQSMHERIFEHVLLVKHDTAKHKEVLLYKSPGLSIDYDYTNLDSALKKGPLHLSSISDIVVNGVPYKLFLCPFKFSDQTFILGGLLSTRIYRQSLTASSYPVIITIGSLVILIIISFPFLKIYFLSRRENINITDVRTLVAAFLLGPSFFLLLLGTGYIFTMGDERTTALLDSLHSSVQRNFYTELDSVLKQMREFDALMDTAKFSQYQDSSVMARYSSLVDYWQEYKKSRAGKRTYSFADLYFYPSTYKNMDGVTWTDSTGRMIAKWNFIDTAFSYLSLRERQYFKDVRDGNLIALPNHPTKDSFAIQPTISWATGGYTVNISSRSNATFKNANEIQRAKMILISANMYSVFNPVTPKGFGFCIVDGSGNTLFHSESSRAMHENILKETDGNEGLVKAIRHKDSVYIDNIKLYGLSVKMIVTPMKNLHYYLVSYYQNREQNLFVFHITAFTFFCTLILFAAFLVFLLAYYLSEPKPSRLLFEPGNPDWMMPKPSKSNYYKQLILFELLLLGFVTILFLFAKQFNTLSFTLVDVAIFLPFLTITGYYIIKNNLSEKMPDHTVGSFFVLNKKILLFYLFTLLVFLLLRKYLIGSSNLKNIAIAALISICLLAFFFTAIFKKDKPQSTDEDKSNYLQYFTFATFLAVIIMSIIPTAGFMYYAFNKELPLQIRTRQLYLSENIERKSREVDYNRRKRKWSFATSSNDSFSSTYNRYQDSLKYSSRYGIYTGSSKLQRVAFDSLKKDAVNNRLYKLVTNYLFLPSDHLDFVSDSPYYYCWFQDTAGATNLKYAIYDSLHKDNAIQLTNRSPRSFAFFNLFNTKRAFVAWLYLIIGLLFIGMHFFLIRSMAKKIFLLNYFRNFEPEYDWMYEQLTTDKKVGDKVVMPAQTNMSRHSFDQYVKNIIAEEEADIVNDENGYDSILKRQFMLEKSYDRLWTECSTEEKFILYDYALDGFTNYKNTDFLYRLCLKGLLRIDEDGQLRIITYSFRNYLIAKTGTDAINQLKQDMNISGTWSSLRNVFYFLLFGIAVFLIVTQQEVVTTKLIVIIPALATLLPQIIKLFDRAGPTASSGDTKSG